MAIETTGWEQYPNTVAAVCAILGFAVMVMMWKYLQNDGDDDDTIRKVKKPWRRCGPMEVCIEIIHTQGNGKLLDSNVIIIESEGVVPAADVKRALEMLMTRYQQLRLRYLNHRHQATVKYFVEMDEAEIDFLEIAGSDWVYVLEMELKTLFNCSAGPLWRVRMLECQEHNGVFSVPLVFTFHHGLLDGISIMKVYREFVGFMEEIATGVEPTIDCIPMSTSLESNLAIKPPGRLIRTIVSLGLPLLLKAAGAWANACPKEISDLLSTNPPLEPEHTTTVLPIPFSAEETRRVVRKSKEMGVTVHGTCTASAAVAFQKVLLKHGALQAVEKIEIPTVFNLSLRRFAKEPIPEESLGVFITFGSLPITLPGNSEESFWDIAKQSLVDIKKIIDGGKPISIMKMSQFLLDVLSRGYEPFLNKKGPTNAFNISNRGSFTIVASGRPEAIAATGRPAETGRYKLVETYWATAEHEGTPHLFVHNIVTIDGRMSWSLVNYKHLVDSAVVEEYAGLIKETIMHACS